jgi:uncharacterized protein YqgC (DUF456 family)
MLLQLAGALLILAAFTSAQVGYVDPRTPSYLALNLTGSAILAYDALHGAECGFFVLELVWAIVSAWGLARVLRGRAPAPAH